MAEKMRKLLKKEYVFRGRKFFVRLDYYQINSKIYTAEIVEHKGAVVILPLLQNKVILIEQYRYPIQKYILELPAGTLEKGEKPEETAKRELIEEIGYKANRLEPLGKFYASPGYTTEILYAYLALNPEKTLSHPEEYEDIKPVIINIDKIPALIKENKIIDGKTLATFMLYFSRRKN